jgi:quercetin dioxygenase-like cupin family protein
MKNTKAEFILSTPELRDDLPFFSKTLGMRLESIFPADDPAVAVFSGHGLRVRLERGHKYPPGKIKIFTDDKKKFADGKSNLIAPNGTKIEVCDLNPTLEIPKTHHSFIVKRLKDEAPWIIGRAGMHYRDLIPSRLGGSIIASHIRIPDGGPVPDMVHYHTVGFQLIYCYKGWVDLVYEDQGPSFRLHEGNCVIQPPEIRHKVLYASDNIEVIEIGVPAEHITTIDHEMSLPNTKFDPNRRYKGQKFVHHKANDAHWDNFRINGLISRDTSIAKNTNNVAGVHVVKAKSQSTNWTSHNADILFNFVLEGSMTLEGHESKVFKLEPGDAFVIPPEVLTRYTSISNNLELLEVSLPGNFETRSSNKNK